MDFEEHRHHEEDETEMEQQQNSTVVEAGNFTTTTTTKTSTRKPTVSTPTIIRYRECLKNHAVNMGGHAVDGCCEFISAGEQGTLNALQCAACNCHRNFHRKETDHGGVDVIHEQIPYHQLPQIFSPYNYNYRAPTQITGYRPYLTTPPPQYRPLINLPASASAGGGGGGKEEDDVSNIPSSSERGRGGVGICTKSIKKKRLRTKFTQEQKEKMLGFAERVGWRIQKHDEDDVSQFCLEIGVTRHVLNVWMHNNKNTFGKKP